VREALGLEPLPDPQQELFAAPAPGCDEVGEMRRPV
jgi:hypothetical protein